MSAIRWLSSLRDGGKVRVRGRRAPLCLCTLAVWLAFVGHLQLSPVPEPILQLVEDSAVQGVNIGKFIEDLSKPLFVEHGFALVAHGRPHGLTEVLAQARKGFHFEFKLILLNNVRENKYAYHFYMYILLYMHYWLYFLRSHVPHFSFMCCIHDERICHTHNYTHQPLHMLLLASSDALFEIQQVALAMSKFSVFSLIDSWWITIHKQLIVLLNKADREFIFLQD